MQVIIKGFKKIEFDGDNMILDCDSIIEKDVGINKESKIPKVFQASIKV